MFRDKAIILLALGQTLIWALIYYVFPALLLRWEQELGWSRADLTAAIAIAVLVSALASPVTGRIIDRGLGSFLLAGSAMLGGIGLLLLSVVVALWQFYAVWALIGLAMAGGLYEPCFAIVTRSRGKDAKQAIILITLAAGFASTISFPVTYGLAEALGWRRTCQVFALVVVFVVAPILWMGANSLEPAHQKSPRPDGASGQSRGFLALPAFWFLAFGFSSLAISHAAAIHHLLPLLDEHGLPPQTAVLAASLIGPMQVAGRLAVMASQNYLSHARVATFAFVAMGLSIVMLQLSGVSLVFLSGFVILFGSAYGTVSILRPLLARDILGQEDFGAKSGALALPYLAGSALAPFLGSLLWEWGGYDLVLATLLGFIGIGASLYIVADRISR